MRKNKPGTQSLSIPSTPTSQGIEPQLVHKKCKIAKPSHLVNVFTLKWGKTNQTRRMFIQSPSTPTSQGIEPPARLQKRKEIASPSTWFAFSRSKWEKTNQEPVLKSHPTQQARELNPSLSTKNERDWKTVDLVCVFPIKMRKSKPGRPAQISSNQRAKESNPSSSPQKWKRLQNRLTWFTFSQKNKPISRSDQSPAKELNPSLSTKNEIDCYTSTWFAFSRSNWEKANQAG